VTARHDGIFKRQPCWGLEEKRQCLEKNGAPLKAQRRRRGVQVRLEHTGHVGLIGKPAKGCDFLDRQRALPQQASRPIDAPLDDVSVRG
jgi:hypothetical protein